MESTPVGVILAECENNEDEILTQKGFQQKDLDSAKDQHPQYCFGKVTKTIIINIYLNHSTVSSNLRFL